MATERPSATMPAYTSIAIFSQFLELISKTRPDRIDLNWLRINGIGESSAFALLSSLKFLRVIDDNGKVLEPRLLIRLGNQPDRRATLKELIDVAYIDLISQTDLESATVQTIDLYFQYQHIAPSVSVKAARFFLWIAREAGYKVGESVQPLIRARPRHVPSIRRENIRQATPDSSNESAHDPIAHEPIPAAQPAQQELTQYEKQLLDILLDNMRASKQLPETSLLKEIMGLIATVKGQPPPD